MKVTLKKPQFHHDCKQCKFIGSSKSSRKADFYICNSDHSEIVIRYSDVPEDNSSLPLSIAMSTSNSLYAEAIQLL